MNYLISLFSLSLLMLTACGPTASTLSSNQNYAVLSSMTPRERALAGEITQAINNYRQQLGQKTLKNTPRLNGIAQAHSAQMAATDSRRVLKSSDTLSASGYSNLKQIAAVFGDRDDTAGKYLNYWKSNQHDILLGNSSAYGIGVKINAEGLSYVTCLFGGYTPKVPSHTLNPGAYIPTY